MRKGLVRLQLVVFLAALFTFCKKETEEGGNADPKCLAPMELAVNDVTNKMATISWKTGGANQWDVAYGMQGFTPESDFVSVTDAPELILTELKNGTSYDVYVRDNCANNKVSEWTGPVSFTTEMVSKMVENKNAVLEDFTGVRCGFCPQGHDIATQLLDTYGEKMVVIGVNAGSYAVPLAGWANFTTPYGDAWVGQAAVAGFPAGTVNRVKYGSGQKGGIAMSRGDWIAAAQARMAETSPVNIGAKAVYNSLTNEITIDIEAYYTSDGNGFNRLNVGIMQDGIVARQAGGSNDYVHNHVLRDMLTGQWGDAIPAEKTVPGSSFTTTLKYTLPADYNGAVIPPGGGVSKIENMEMFVYIAKNTKDIYTGIRVPIEIQ